ncbi:10292_t:CDS:2, partial [Dentiscutata heterogama]
QKITTIESNIQYKNELTEGSFETNDTIDLTESTPTETTVELTNTRKKSFFESLNSEQNSKQVTVEDKITRYFAIPVDPNTNPLDWWCHFGKDFSILASMVLCYLSVQDSSIPLEQAFSMSTTWSVNLKYNSGCSIWSALEQIILITQSINLEHQPGVQSGVQPRVLI